MLYGHIAAVPTGIQGHRGTQRGARGKLAVRSPVFHRLHIRGCLRMVANAAKNSLCSCEAQRGRWWRTSLAFYISTRRRAAKMLLVFRISTAAAGLVSGSSKPWVHILDLAASARLRGRQACPIARGFCRSSRSRAAVATVATRGTLVSHCDREPRVGESWHASKGDIGVLDERAVIGEITSLIPLPPRSTYERKTGGAYYTQRCPRVNYFDQLNQSINQLTYVT